MPYTCVSGASGYGGVRIWGLRACSRGGCVASVASRGALAGGGRAPSAKKAQTAGRPGERAAAASQAPSACARPAVGALLALSLQRGSLV